MKRLNLILSAILVLLFAGIFNIPSVIAADEPPPPQYGSPIDFIPPPNYSVFLPTIINGGSAAPTVAKSDPLADLVSTVINGIADQVVGVYSIDVLGMPVVQQPDGDSAFINNAENTITQFTAAASFGNTGLLAHNTKAGIQFFDLKIGQEVVIIYGDGSTRKYRIDRIRTFQALDPTNTYSDFIDLENSALLSSNKLFLEVYGGQHHLTFQTCIEQNGIASWGRIFIMATPL
jgi:hypothetical protein